MILLHPWSASLEAALQRAGLCRGTENRCGFSPQPGHSPAYIGVQDLPARGLYWLYTEEARHMEDKRVSPTEFERILRLLKVRALHPLDP